MESKKIKSKTRNKQIIGRGKPGPGRKPNKAKMAPVIDFLREELSRDIPITLIERLSENLSSRDPKVFLDSFKIILNLLPPLKQGRVLSPHVMAVMTKYWGEFAEGEVIEDLSKLTDMDNEN